MRRAARTDPNQKEIVAALRAVGATVAFVHQLGAGFPDLAVGWKGRTYLLEVKADDGGLTPDQVRWHATWRGHVAVVRNVAEALLVLQSEAA